MGVRLWNVWMTEGEVAILDRASEALELERTTLFQEGAFFEAYRLGVRWSLGEPPPPLNGTWKFLPDRSSESTSVRVGVSVSIQLAELVRRAARHVDTTDPKFLVGAMLAYIGRLQRCYEGQFEEEAQREKIRAALKEIKLPWKYQYRVSREK